MHRIIGNEKVTVCFQFVALKYRVSNNFLQDTKIFGDRQILYDKGMVCIIVINTEYLATQNLYMCHQIVQSCKRPRPLSVSAGYMKNAIAERSLRSSASAPEMWYCTVLGLMLSASAISL